MTSVGHHGVSHGKRNVQADLQMVAAYAAAQVAHRDDGHVSQSHSPDYRQPTSNGNSVGLFNNTCSSMNHSVISCYCTFPCFHCIVYSSPFLVGFVCIFVASGETHLNPFSYFANIVSVWSTNLQVKTTKAFTLLNGYKLSAHFTINTTAFQLS